MGINVYCIIFRRRRFLLATMPLATVIFNKKTEEATVSLQNIHKAVEIRGVIKNEKLFDDDEELLISKRDRIYSPVPTKCKSQDSDIDQLCNRRFNK